MAETHVISALTHKRAEVSGEIKHYEKLLKKSKLNLQSIDQTIHLFDESYDLRTIKAKRVRLDTYFKTGEAKIAILDTLRVAIEPMRTDELAKIIALNKQFDRDTEFDSKYFQKTLVTSLGLCERNNLVECIGKDGLTKLWKIKS